MQLRALLLAGLSITMTCHAREMVPTATDASTVAVSGAVSAKEAAAVPMRADPLNPPQPDFGVFEPPEKIRENSRQILATGDNHRQPFIIIDKVAAKVAVFDASGRLRGVSSALLGMAIGDTTAPGIGNKKLRDIPPPHRTTPAGRFDASLDRNVQGHEILWIDYEASISLHAVVAGTPGEHRAARLASSSPHDKRISYGCVNVPGAFFEHVVAPLFRNADGVVYVLPEAADTRAKSVGMSIQPTR